MDKKILTNILLIMAIIMALIYVYVTYGTFKNFTAEQNKMRAFYVTNAGINQAIWYLSTPTSIGGYGPKWRTKEMKKYFSVGYYTISVEDGRMPGEIIITSQGEAEGVRLMLQVTAVYGKSLPKTFDYAIWSGDELGISGNSKIDGNIFVNDNLSLKDSSAIRNGRAYTMPGYNVEALGSSRCEKGVTKRPYPVFPVLDTSFYYEKIATAKSKDGNIIQGDASYKNIDLGGKTIYVNGNVSIRGEIKGSGSIVCTRNMSISGSVIGGGAFLICNGKTGVSGSNFLSGNSYIYSKQKLSLESGAAIKGSAVILSPTVIDIGDKCSISGLIYAPTIIMGKDVTIKGSIVAENFGPNGTLNDIDLKYDGSILPLTALGFNIGSEIIMTRPGALKEI